MAETTDSEQRQGPLAGIRVLDFTQFLAGPHGTQILGDLGAEIIKIEPAAGDSSRVVPPHYVEGSSLYFHTINRNKRSIALDLKAPGAIDLLRELIDECDVVVESFRPGVLSRLGLDRDEERARKPELVWCSISGFGQDGPGAKLPAYDMIVQALSGTMSLTGEPDGKSVRTGNPIGDIAAGLHAAIGIQAALLRRASTGLGDFVDISMLDCLIALLSYQGTYYLNSGIVPGRQGAGHDAIPTYRLFATADVDIVTTANTERMWQAMADVLGVPELLDDPRFALNPDRLRHKEELWAVIEPAFRTRPAAHWVEAFNAAGIPIAVVNDLAAALSHPQVLHREMVVTVDSAEGESVRTLGNPIKLADSARTHDTFPQRIGAEGEAILRDVLGYDDGRIECMLARGILIPAAQKVAV